jgi:hypothetical protein
MRVRSIAETAFDLGESCGAQDSATLRSPTWQTWPQVGAGRGYVGFAAVEATPVTMDRKYSIRGLTSRLFPGRRDMIDDDLDIVVDDRDIVQAAGQHEPGDAYLLMEVINLLRFGKSLLSEFGLPAGTLLLGPHDDEIAARALWVNSLTDEQPRSNELDQSLERVLGINPRHEGANRAIPAVDDWLRRRFGQVQMKLASDPLVWQLSTPLGAFQALVDATTFGPLQAEDIRRDTIQRILERLRMDVWHDRKTDPDRAELLRKHMAEIEDLDVTLYRLSQEPPGQPFSRIHLERSGLLGELRI